MSIVFTLFQPGFKSANEVSVRPYSRFTAATPQTFVAERRQGPRLITIRTPCKIVKILLAKFRRRNVMRATTLKLQKNWHGSAVRMPCLCAEDPSSIRDSEHDSL